MAKENQQDDSHSASGNPKIHLKSKAESKLSSSDDLKRKRSGEQSENDNMNENPPEDIIPDSQDKVELESIESLEEHKEIVELSDDGEDDQKQECEILDKEAVFIQNIEKLTKYPGVK